MKKDDYSGRMWDKYDTLETWQGFMRHNYPSPSRYLAYYLIMDLAHRVGSLDTLDFAEIGFGDARDFQVCFAELEKVHWIHYTGYEIVPHFVEFAQQRWGQDKFRLGGFLDLEPDSYDVTYTRHAFEMIAPELFIPSLRCLLRATRKVCTIAWHKVPQKEEDAAFRHGAWMNTYSVAAIYDVIEEEGFRQTRKPEEAVYWLEREE